MDIQTRKINFIQEFLRLKNEKLVLKLEKLLFLEKKKIYERSLSPMTEEEFNQIINEAKIDAKEGKVVEARQLKEDINSWQ